MKLSTLPTSFEDDVEQPDPLTFTIRGVDYATVPFLTVATQRAIARSESDAPDGETLAETIDRRIPLYLDPGSWAKLQPLWDELAWDTALGVWRLVLHHFYPDISVNPDARPDDITDDVETDGGSDPKGSGS